MEVVIHQAAGRADGTGGPAEAPVEFVDGWHSFGLVLLGDVGFLDQFTIAASRLSQAVAVEDRDSFDDRFGVVMA